jgi:hypothetical protein
VTITYEIHPAIGIARLGASRLTSEDGFFVGPEPDGAPPSRYRDPGGDLKRQAARIRLFACRRDASGKLLEASELALSDVRRLTSRGSDLVLKQACAGAVS